MTSLLQEAWGFINGAYFKQYIDGGAGSGNIDAFVRIQSNGVEQGYNTDYRPLEFNEKNSPFTHSLLLSDVPLITKNGTSYREFLLDLNQNTQFLSLDDLKIALHASGNLIGYSTIFASPIYDIDAGEDNWVKLDSLNAGSGEGDMLFCIPDSLFTGPNQYVYLYSRFGENFPANNGFEEWAYGVDAPISPEPATILLLGLGGLALLRKRRN